MTFNLTSFFSKLSKNIKFIKEFLRALKNIYTGEVLNNGLFQFQIELEYVAARLNASFILKLGQ